MHYVVNSLDLKTFIVQCIRTKTNIRSVLLRIIEVIFPWTEMNACPDDTSSLHRKPTLFSGRKCDSSTNSLTRLVGHGRPGQKHGVQGDDGGLEKTRAWLRLLVTHGENSQESYKSTLRIWSKCLGQRRSNQLFCVPGLCAAQR